MDQQYPTVAKIPILDTGKFEQSQFQIQQYLQHEHYALWEVIEFGDSYEVPTNTTDTTTTTTTSGETGTKSGRTVTLTAEDMQKKKNDVKARTTLLLSLPDEHQLRFSKYKTARELWAAIHKTFGGNEATKKTKKNLLKQQYGNFRAEGSKTLEQTFSRLQVIVGQLQFMDVEVKQDDLNQKFLTSLAPEWLMHTIVRRNRSDLDTMSLDDLYNHLKMGHFARECRAPRSQDKGRRDNFRQGEDHALVPDEEAPTEFALMANTSTESKKLETLKQEKEGVDGKLAGLLTASKDLDNLIESQRSDKNKEGLGYTVVPPPPVQLYLSPKKDLSWTSLPECTDDTVTNYSRPSPTVESTSEEDQNRNPSVSENVASPITPKPFIKFVKLKDSQSESKIDKKETPKKPPVKYAEQYRKPNKKPNVRGNQRNWNNLKSHQLGLEFVIKKKACFNCGDFNHLAYDCRKRTSSGRGLERRLAYKDQMWQGLTNQKLSASTVTRWVISQESVEYLKVRKEEGKKTIDMGEDHALVADAEVLIEFALMANTESKVFDNSLCSNDYKKNNDSLNTVAQTKGRLVEYKEREVKYIEKIRTLEMYRASNLKGIKTLDKQLEELKLEKDGLDEKLAGLLKASKKLDNLIKSQRSDKVKEGVGYNVVPPPAADLYLSPKKDLSWTGLPEFVDDTVTNYSRPSSTIASTSAEGQNKDSSTSEDGASPNTPKPFVKFVKSKDSQSESKTDKQETPKKPQVKYAEQYRHSNKKPNVKGNQRNWNNLKSYQLGPEFVLNKKACFNCGDFSHLANDCRKRVQRDTTRKFPTASRKFTTGSTKTYTADIGRKGKAGSSQNNIDDKGYWDSGCSRHMTGNISYLSDFEPFDSGYVSFGQGGCKITGKGTIKTNSECIMLRRNFKLLDDANILLRIPRQHNMYSINLNDIIPHKDLTCLVAKAFVVECILWHKSLGHLNVKTMNKLVRHNLVRGLTTKSFDNDHTCTACLKGKQYKASCKSKSKDETSDFLKKFINEIENLKDLKVKIIRVLVNKSQNKTPYELFNGRTPAIGFLKPFGCHVMILNTLDNLGKFEAKGDEGSGNFNPTASSSNPPADQMETLTVESPIPTVSSLVPTACLNDSPEPSDRKSTTGGSQFLGRRLISWQCKKQTIVATSTTEAEYVAAASCCGQLMWIQNQLLDYGLRTSKYWGVLRMLMIGLRLILLGEFNTDFHLMVDFIAASPLRHILKLRDEDGIVSIPDTELFENMTLMGASIAQSSALLTVADEPASPMRDVSEGEACPTESGLIADQDRATIAKSSTLPYDSAPRVTSPSADEGSMQQTISELTALCTSLQRQHYELLVKFQAQEEEILRLKERVQVLEDRDSVAAKHSGDDASIKGRSINKGEATAERISNDSEEVARVLTSIDAATVLARGIDVPTGSGSIPTAGPPTTVISTGSERLQEQIDAQVTRELEEQQEREDMRMNEQIARDAEVARIHAEEELQGMIDRLDRSNETIAKYLQEYQDFASELPLEKR
nr:ribonuclease H-like domain-containing protein [Tanacetum cinerariifolium]